MLTLNVFVISLTSKEKGLNVGGKDFLAIRQLHFQILVKGVKSMFKFKERVVKFSDNTYGIQVSRGNWFKGPTFLWLTLESQTSTICDEYFHRQCKNESLAYVQKILHVRQNPPPPFSFVPVLDAWEG